MASSSTSIEIEHIRADVGQAVANLNAIIARIHSRTGRGLRDNLSSLFSVPEITALQQHASQAAQVKLIQSSERWHLVG